MSLFQYVPVPDSEIDYKYGYSGLYITSMSRHYLLSTIKKLIDKGATFLYADTDSILFRPGEDGFKSWAFIDIDEEELGR